MSNSVSRTYCHITAIFIRILLCDILTVLRCYRMPFFTRGQGKIFRDPRVNVEIQGVFHLPKDSRKFRKLRREMFIGEGRVPFDTVVPFIPRLPSPSDVFPAKIQNGGTTFVVEQKARDFSWKNRVWLIQMMISFLSWRRLQPIWEKYFACIIYGWSIWKPIQDDSRDLWTSVPRRSRSTSHRKSSSTTRVWKASNFPW